MSGTSYADRAPAGAWTTDVRAAVAANVAPVGAGVLVLLVGLKSGGYFPTTWGWLGVALAWIAALALLLSNARLGKLELFALGALAAYVAWVALSRVWSDAPGHTLTEVQRDIVYPLALCCALLLVRREAVAVLAGSVAAALSGVVLYGLLTRLFPERLGASDPIARYRLSAPVGYWNTLGILASMAILLAFGFAARGRLWGRPLAAAALVGLAPTLYFTFSRGAVIALAIGLAALFLVDPRRLQTTLAALLLVPLPVVATWRASQYTALTTTAAPLHAATRDGHRLAAIVLALAVVNAVAALVFGLMEPRVPVGIWLRRGYAAGVTCAALAAAALVVGHFGGPARMVERGYDSFRGPPAGSTAAGSDLTRRFSNLSSNGRLPLWEAAWHDAKRRPLVGSGAGGFEWYWAQHQPATGGKARDAHSLYMETFAEMGAIGLVLIVLAILLPLGAILRGRHHRIVPFVVAAYIAFAAHIGADWDWEMPVVILSGVFCAAAIMIAGRRDDGTVAFPP